MTLRERILLGIIASGLAIAVVGPCEVERRETPVTIQEDDAGWRCWEMGNKICGPGKE